MYRPTDRPPDLLKGLQPNPTHVLRTPQSSTLPLQLQAEVPTCSQQCLATYIREGFNCSGDGIACLCRKYSSQGFTLGELAYLCLSRSCSQPSRAQSLAQYNICSDILGAVSATHSVLTANPTGPATSSTSTSIRRDPNPNASALSASRSSRRTSHPTTTASGPRFKSTSTLGSLTDRASHTPSSEPASTSDSTPARSHSRQITTAQTVGIAIGVLTFIVLIAAAMYFFCCFRRRNDDQSDAEHASFFSRFRRRKQSQSEDEKSYDFVDRGPPQLSPMLTIRPANEIRITDRDTINCWQQLASSPQQRQQNVEGSTRVSARSNARKETTVNARSRPPNVQSTRQTPSARSRSAETVPTLSSQRLAPPVQSPATRSRSDENVPSVSKGRLAPPVRDFNGFGLPPNPKAAYYSPNLNPSTGQATTPKSQDWPLFSNEFQFGEQLPTAIIPAPIKILPPQPPAADWLEPPLSAVSKSLSRDSSGSLLNYYASSEAGIVTSPTHVESPRVLEREPPILSKATSDSTLQVDQERSTRPRKDTTGSDTSFESSDEDERAPVEDGKDQLSPVIESPPLLRSPIAGIKYPSIPKSASQTALKPRGYRPPQPSFPHSPKTPKAWHETSSLQPAYPARTYQQQQLPAPRALPSDRRTSDHSILSGSTLVEKRRGKNKAHGLELSLDKEGSAYTPFNKLDQPTSQDTRNACGLPSNPRPQRGELPLKDAGRIPDKQHSSRNKKPRRHRSQRIAKENSSWDRNITPSRKGDDLYLHFGAASPIQPDF